MDGRRGAFSRIDRGALRLATCGVLLVGACLLTAAPAAAAPAVPDAKAKVSAYIVQLAEQPAASYRGGRAGLPATRPAPGQKLNSASANVRRYAAYLDGRHSAVLRAAGAADTAKFYDYRYSFNGFSAVLTPSQVARIARDPAVRSITQDRLHRPHTDNAPAFLGLSGSGGLWSGAGGPGGAGENIIVGVIDTGIWPERPSVSDQTDPADRPAARASACARTGRLRRRGAARARGRAVVERRLQQQAHRRPLLPGRLRSLGHHQAGPQVRS